MIPLNREPIQPSRRAERRARRWRWAAPAYLLGLFGLLAGCSLLSPPVSGPALLGSRGDPERGAYLALIFTCVQCHTVTAPDGVSNAQGALLAGGVPFGGPWGNVASANLTQIVPGMDDATLERAIRGKLTYLYAMPTPNFNQMAQQDMRDLIAYLRTLRPTANPAPLDTFTPGFEAPPLNSPVAVPEVAPQGATVARGEYLVIQGTCDGCHTPTDAQGNEEPGKWLAGGPSFPGPNNTNYVAQNLTPDPSTGALVSWTDAEVARAIREGVAPDGHLLNPAMPYAQAYYVYTDEDIAAIIAYLRQIPPVNNPLPSNPAWQAAP